MRATRHLFCKPPDARIHHVRADVFEACRLIRHSVQQEINTLIKTDTTKLMSALISVIKSRPQHAGVRIQVFSAILSLMNEDPPKRSPTLQKNRNLFLKEGADIAMYATMKQHKDDIKFHSLACCLISSLADDMLSLPVMRTQAAARAALLSMEAHAEDASLNTEVLSALVSLCSEMNLEIVKQTIRATVTCLRTHKNHKVLWALACKLLQDLGRGSDLSVGCMWEEGVQTVCLAGLNMVAAGDGHDGVDDIQQHCHDETSLDSHVIIGMCEVICQMYVIPYAREEPGLAVMARLVIKYKQDIEVLGALCQVVVLTCLQCAQHREMFGRPMIQAMLLVLDKATHNSVVRTSIIATVGALALKSQSNVMYLTEEDAMRTWLPAWHACMLDPEMCKETTCLLLKEVVRLGEAPTLYAVLKAGCVQRITSWITSPEAKEKKALAQACDVLSALTLGLFAQHKSDAPLVKQQAFCNRIVQEGYVEALAHALPMISACTAVLTNCITSMVTVLRCSNEYLMRHARCVIKPGVNIMMPAHMHSIDSEEGLLQLAACELVCEALSGTYARLGSHAFRSVRDEFLECEGIQALATCLHLCGSNSAAVMRLRASNAIPRLPHCALAIMSCFVCGGDGATRLISYQYCSPLIEAVLLIMDQYNKDKEIQILCVGALYAMIEDDGANMLRIVGRNGMHYVTQALGLLESHDQYYPMVYQTQQLMKGTNRAVPAKMLQQKPQQVARGRNLPHNAMPSKRQGSLHGNTTAHQGSSSSQREELTGGDVCSACGKSAADVGAVVLLRCSACVIAPLYCSVACQQASWPQHKAECKANRKASK
jgi:hypothetical protein